MYPADPDPRPGTDVDPAPPAPTGAAILLPGSPAARAAGCGCSVLANAAYRCGASASPLIEATCPIAHGEPAT
ncbi:hypothetical protein PHK61_13885 [Actinomycetospora lutea]|uniref:hypothetical protein n=1 Tax=Actinomycetospora lutea TaxID=663604 RepID=UPI0023651D20|nr:hypothetical protein [Actinomycetospora lutea]MDD7939509.1 hypothetical protein [Actinomycetospora lutea]